MTGRTGTSRPRAVVAVVVGVLVALGALGLLYAWISAPSGASRVSYSRFLEDVGGGSVARVVQEEATLDVNVDTGAYVVTVPGPLTDVYGDMQLAADAGGVLTPEFSAVAAPDTFWVGLILTALLPVAVVLLLFGLLLVFARRSSPQPNAGSLADRLRQLDEALRSGLITDEEHAQQRARILNEA